MIAETILLLYVIALSYVTMGYGLTHDRGPFVLIGFALFWIGGICVGLTG